MYDNILKGLQIWFLRAAIMDIDNQWADTEYYDVSSSKTYNFVEHLPM